MVEGWSPEAGGLVQPGEEVVSGILNSNLPIFVGGYCEDGAFLLCTEEG